MLCKSNHVNSAFNMSDRWKRQEFQLPSGLWCSFTVSHTTSDANTYRISTDMSPKQSPKDDLNIFSTCKVIKFSFC